jgi:Na+-transporting NADH:ubiquinone oxidoreductase subunit B
MKPVRKMLDRVEPLFHKGGKLELLYPLYEAIDTFLYTPGEITDNASHVRDGMDLKRMMTIVVVALVPCILMAMYNTGYQANLAIAQTSPEMSELAAVPTAEAIASQPQNWQQKVINAIGIGYDPGNFLANFIHGALFFLPIYIVCMAAGGTAELVFSLIRRHEVNEGFLVTGMLFPLTLPPTIPLWQVAIGIIFGVVVGKEIFGGTGKNFLNVALTARAFLYFAYPAQSSGDSVWTAVDGFSGATTLTWLHSTPVSEVKISAFNIEGMGISFWDSFLGTIQGSMGETSTLACLLGAGLLIFTGVGSWRIMASMVVGALALGALFYGIGSETNALFGLPPWYHLVIGGFAFGTVFMATDPVSASMTQTGQYYYGALIGGMTVLVRVINPAFPEGVMLAILFGNVFAPLIDHFVIQANVRRRMARNVA